jgi:exonuclease SbcD
MTPFRFVHAADLHLDTPFRGLERLADWLSPVLADATLRTWDRLVEATIARGADFLVLAGDVFDHTTPTLRAQFRIRDGLDRLAEAGIPVFWAHGNHDPYATLDTNMEWPSNLVRFPPGKAHTHPVIRHGETLCTVSGISYPTRAVHDNYAALLTRPSEAPWAVAVLHGNVGGQPGHDNYAPASLSDLARQGFDYWALGHIHQHLALANEPWVIYPGNLQGRHPRETGRKGAVLVEVDAGGTARPVFLPLNVVRWEVVTVDVTGLDHVDGVADRAERALRDIHLDSDEEGLLARLFLTGRTPLAAHDIPDLDTVAERLSDATQATPFQFVESIQPHWRPPGSGAPPTGFWAEVLEAMPSGSAGDLRALLAGPWERQRDLELDPGYVQDLARRLLAEALGEELPDAD